MTSLLRFIWLFFCWYALFVAMMSVVYIAVPPVSTVMLASAVTGDGMRRQWVPIEKISSNLQRAVLVAEDGRFCEHGGVDWEAAEKAYNINERKGRISHGASTISMQVARNLFLWNGRVWVRKVLEVPIAMWLDLIWSKKRMLEVYLNTAEWGKGVFGAEAGARHAFGQSAAYLSPYQAALMAAALPNPKDRYSGSPGEYQAGLASNITGRMARDPGVAACVRR